MSRYIKFGWILQREGVISRDQLRNILNLQEKHKDKLFGEIASYYFSITEEEIETVFAKHILLPFTKKWFNDELTKKMTLDGLQIEDFVTDIELSISNFARNIIRTSVYKGHENKFVLQSGTVKLKINSTMEKLTLKTNLGRDIILEDIPFELEVPAYKLIPANTQIISEAKLRLKQLSKKQQQEREQDQT
ncbi:MAG: hypothetical protein KKB30_09525 [Proteobacteria bacterium]|nr:hypothetical protein [Pseudomonadota bacterium]MBU1716959.1 hypothetical protein [Pseudomonadota bacterium]